MAVQKQCRSTWHCNNQTVTSSLMPWCVSWSSTQNSSIGRVFTSPKFRRMPNLFPWCGPSDTNRIPQVRSGSGRPVCALEAITKCLGIHTGPPSPQWSHGRQFRAFLSWPCCWDGTCSPSTSSWPTCKPMSRLTSLCNCLLALQFKMWTLTNICCNSKRTYMV